MPSWLLLWVKWHIFLCCRIIWICCLNVSWQVQYRWRACRREKAELHKNCQEVLKTVRFNVWILCRMFLTENSTSLLVWKLKFMQNCVYAVSFLLQRNCSHCCKKISMHTCVDQENRNILGDCLKVEQVSVWEVGVVSKHNHFSLCFLLFTWLCSWPIGLPDSEGTGPGGMT